MSRPGRILLLALAFVAGCSDSSGPEIFGCDKVARYNIGETVNGSIRTSDCADPDEFGRVDFFQVRQSASGPVSFVLDVPAGSVTMFIFLIDSNEELVDFAEVSPGEAASVGGLLDEGTYFVAISAGQPGTQSTYTLSSERAIRLSGPPFLGCTIIQAYTYGATVNGTLADGDCETAESGFMDRYQFTLATARTVTITLASNNFDAFLYLFNSEGAILARNDDDATSLNSRISIALPAGTYSIGAAALEGIGSGAYSLRTQ